MYKIHKQYRLPGYNYADYGNYFITICTLNRHKQYFGSIKNNEMVLSAIGKIVSETWQQVPNNFPNILLNEFQIMPDHFHAIIRNRKELSQSKIIPVKFNSGILNNPMELKEKSLGYIVRWFKGKVKYEAGKIEVSFKWQPRFHERIIRNDNEFYFIEEYIRNNVSNYDRDKNIDEQAEIIKNLQNFKENV